MATSQFTVRPLDRETWSDFAALVERHNGVWGGCWCLGFHQRGTGNADMNRKIKQCLVEEGRAQAALVYSGDRAVGWCQFGRSEELPRIKYRKRVEAARDAEPDWRITCFFVDREFRRQGVTSAALTGALELIAAQGGGLVESYPEEVAPDRKASGSFLWNSTLSIFERHGFSRVERIGKHAWLVERRLQPT